MRHDLKPSRIDELRLTEDEVLRSEYRAWCLEKAKAGQLQEVSSMITSFLQLAIKDVPAHYVTGEEPPRAYNEALEYFQLAMHKASQVPTVEKEELSSQEIASMLRGISRDWQEASSTLLQHAPLSEAEAHMRELTAKLDEAAERYEREATDSRPR